MQELDDPRAGQTPVTNAVIPRHEFMHEQRMALGPNFPDHARFQQQQQQFQQQQQQQQRFQAEVAAKYGAKPGQPLTGAVVSPLVAPPLPTQNFGYETKSQTISNPNFNDLWNPYAVPTSAPALSYVPQQNMQSELDVLRTRMVQIESAMGSIGQIQTHRGSGDGQKLENDDNVIDPLLFNDYDNIDIYRMICPPLRHVNIENNGLLEHNSLIKRDYVAGLVYVHLLKYGEELPKPTISNTTDKFFKQIHNPSFEYEQFYKYEKSSLEDLLQRVERRLPTKKIIWLMIQKFFSTIAHPYCPTLDEGSFYDGVARIIGGKDPTDTQVKLHVSLANNSDLVILLKLMFVVRIIQISLVATTKPDKNNNYLLKNSQPSDELEFLTKVFFTTLLKFNIGEGERMKLHLMALFMATVSFNGIRSLEYSPANLLNIALQLNINNQGDGGSAEKVKATWYTIYTQYYTINAQYGLPIFLSEEFFDIELGDTGEVGKKFQKAIIESYTKQTEIFRALRKVVNAVHKTEHGLSVSTLYGLMIDYDQAIEQQNGHFDQFKKEIGSTYSEKVGKCTNDLLHKLVKSRILALILLHYENTPGSPMKEFLKYTKVYGDLCCDTITVAFDIFENYNLYFSSGYEFLIFSHLFVLLEKILKQLPSLLMRMEIFEKPYTSILRLFLNLIEELDKYPVLKNYVQLFRMQNRMKILMHMMKRQFYGEIDIFQLKFDYHGEEVDFTGFPSKFRTMDESALESLDESFDRVNSRFRTKYTKLATKKELFDIIDFEEPEFDANYLS